MQNRPLKMKAILLFTVFPHKPKYSHLTAFCGCVYLLVHYVFEVINHEAKERVNALWLVFWPASREAVFI